MVCEVEIWENKILYCYTNNIWFVGDNTTTSSDKPSAVKSITDVEGTLRIPKYVQGNAITQIGYFAFFQCSLITSVIIEAKIDVINTRAFSQASNVKYFYVPSSVQYIYSYVFDIYVINTQAQTQGLTTIVFEPNTHLKYAGQNSFAWREYIYVFVGNTIEPERSDEAIYRTELTVKSPYSVSFCGKQSEIITKELYFAMLGRTLNKVSQLSCYRVIHSLYLFIVYILPTK